jgi:hypothetical protein
LIAGAGFDTSAALGNWSRGMGGTSWSNSDVEGCASGSVLFASGGRMSYCIRSLSAGTDFYLGTKAKVGPVGCIGQFYDGASCDGNGVGPVFLNLYTSGSSSWGDEATPGPIAAPTGTHSLNIDCQNYGDSNAYIDQIYVNKISSTGFGG